MMKRKHEGDNHEPETETAEPCDLYRSLVKAIAKSAAEKKLWPFGLSHYSAKNARTSEITSGFGGYNQLLMPTTLVEITTGIRWTGKDKKDGKTNEIERDVAVLREYYLQARYLDYIHEEIEECDRQINGKPEERKMGDVWYIQIRKDKYETDYQKAKMCFDVFVKNNPRLKTLL